MKHLRKEVTVLTSQMSTVFIGLDAGGTSTRALMATAQGEVWRADASVIDLVHFAQLAEIDEDDSEGDEEVVIADDTT